MDVESYIEQAPESCRGVMRRAFAGNSLRAAINAKCLACCNYVREDITHCRVTICPLWHLRPYQVKAKKRPGRAQRSPAKASYAEEQSQVNG